MPITITCQTCNKSYKLKTELAGKKVKCKCGQSMIVPQSAAAVDPLAAELSDLDAGDPMSSVLDEALPTSDGPAPVAKPVGQTPTPAAPRPTAPRPTAQKAVTGDYRRAARIANEAAGYAADEAVKDAKKNSGPGATKMALISVAIVLGLVLGTVGLMAGVYWLRLPGFRTIEETYAIHQEAVLHNDWEMQFRTFTPQRQDEMLHGMVVSVSWRLDPNSPSAQVLKQYDVTEPAEDPDAETYEDLEAELMPEALAAALLNPNRDLTTEEYAELDAIEDEIFRRLSLVREKEEERRLQMIASVENKPAFFSDLMKASAKEAKMATENSMAPRGIKILATLSRTDGRKAEASRKLADVVIDGDTATGQTMPALALGDAREAEPIAFRRIDGRWYIDICEEFPEEDWSDSWDDDGTF